MKTHLKSILALTVICAVVSLLLALTNEVTAPIIQEQEDKASNAAFAVVLPNGEDFQLQDTAAYTLPDSITEVYSEKNGGYVFKMTTTGYASNFVIMCGIDASGTVTGATVIASGETLGVEAEYGTGLVDATLDTIDTVDTVSGATKTTTAYRGAVKDALNAFAILGGGSVDLRDEQQILADNLNAALPAAEGAFSALFITEETESISAVYRAENGAGYVFLSGDSFVATDSEGMVISPVSNDLKSFVEVQAATILRSQMTELDINAGYADMPSQVLKAYETSGGNYVFDLRAAGFGITGDEWYAPSGEYIYLRVSVTPAGKIIACETTSQKESADFGAACADPSFYTQFNGKNEETYKEIDAISGATITTNAYKTAISKALEAVKILKGES